MLKFLLKLTFLLGISVFSTNAQVWEVDPSIQYKPYFDAAYNQFPKIPRGVLEAIAYHNTHLKPIDENTLPSCTGRPKAFGIMGLIEDGKGYFSNNLVQIADLSKMDVNRIKKETDYQIMAFAAAYDQLIQQNDIRSSDPLDHASVICALSEFPLERTPFNRFIYDSYLYSVYMNMNQPIFQQRFQLPAYDLDLEKFFGETRYNRVSAATLSLSEIESLAQGATDTTNYRGSMNCFDISAGFPYTVLFDPADPSNFSSRSGTAISHVTIHTMQGSYTGAISWFKNPSANVSAHYNMRSTDGQITQMVCEADKAWHVGNSNPYTVGIEHEGYVSDPSWYTSITYEVSAALTKDISARYGIPTVRTYDINGDLGVNPISDGCFKIKGHQHYPSQTHTDPGPFWDWNRYYDLINNPVSALSQSYTNCSGTIYDSGGSTSNYSNDERIFYRIEPIGATSISLQFTMLDLELNYDYLYIYDGDTPEDPLLMVLNGTVLPPVIQSNSGKILMEFRTDCGTVASGWVANYTCSTTAPSCSMPSGLTESNSNHNQCTLNWNAVVGAQGYELSYRRSLNDIFTTIYTASNSATIQGLATGAQYYWKVRTICSPGDTSAANGTQFIHQDIVSDIQTQDCSGRFTDTGGDLGGYADNENYTFTIEPNGASSVSIVFSSFELESNYDFLYIYDGNSTAANLLGTYSGSTLPPPITSSGGALTIRFDSDFRTVRSGWDLDWTCSQSSFVYGDTILLNSDQIGELDCSKSYHRFYDSGSFSGAYGNNEDHTQTFCNPDNTKSVRLTFMPNPTAAQQLSLSSQTAGNDYLSIYNGADINANMIGSYTGASSAAPQPGTFISTGECLTVRMQSDQQYVGNGFIARLYCEDRPVTLPTSFCGGSFGNQLFIDDGGQSSNYSNNQSYIKSYCPDASLGPNQGIWAEFTDTIGLERNWDYLYVFDGDDPLSDRLICAYTGNVNDQNILNTIKSTVENSSGCLTFQFYSDAATTASGWEAVMQVATPREPFGGVDCANAQSITAVNTFYAGSTMLQTGEPSTNDPALNIAISGLIECSGVNTITRLENTTWYRFTTPDSVCEANTFQIVFDNISCQSLGSNGSGVQFVLYDGLSCFSGSTWPQPLYCRDKVLNGDSVDVRSYLQPNTSYFIMIDGFTGQNCNFDIQLQSITNSGVNCLLSLDLIQFYGEKIDQVNRISWQTENEQFLSYFAIQRFDERTKDYQTIDILPATGTSSITTYSVDDKDYQRNRVSYYRLQIVNQDGTYSFSKSIALDRKEGGYLFTPVSIYPNPVDNELYVQIEDNLAPFFQLNIYDPSGKKCVQFDQKIDVGNIKEVFDMRQLPSGNYIYQLLINGISYAGKFQKL